MAAHLVLTSIVLLVAGAGAGCSGRACETGTAGAARAARAPRRPAACREVSPGTPLSGALAAAADGEALCLAPGLHEGPVTITREVSLWGPPDAVVVGRAPGSVVTVMAAGTTLAGFTVDGTGGRFDRFDAAVHVQADDVTVHGLTIVHPVYGILVEKARRAAVRGNLVAGEREVAMGLRGDTIRLWETHDSVIEDNEVHDGRDMVVWYSSNNRIVGNRIRGGRYGTHFMYSHDNVVAGNSFRGGIVGVFVMYSRRVTLADNLIADVAGAGGMGVGLKDSSDITLEGNLVLRATIGLYIDQTPGDVGATLNVRGNVWRQCDSAVVFHTTPHGTDIGDNDFADNMESFKAATGTNPRGAHWHDNYFDDYAGYDLDGDQRGDMPYEHQSASEDLIARRPEVAFFRGSPVLGMLDTGSKLLPVARPRVIVTDLRPRMEAHELAPWTDRFSDDTPHVAPSADARGVSPSTEDH